MYRHDRDVQEPKPRVLRLDDAGRFMAAKRIQNFQNGKSEVVVDLELEQILARRRSRGRELHR